MEPPGTPSAARRAPPGASARLFTYAFALADPPHPSPQAFYYDASAASHYYSSRNQDSKEHTHYRLLLARQQQRQHQHHRLLLAGGASPRYAARPHHTGFPCTNCGITASSTWRRIRPPLERSCNSCYDHYQRRGRYRPIAGLPRRVVGVDLVPEGDSWPAMVARAAQQAAAEAQAGEEGVPRKEEEEEEEEEEEDLVAEGGGGEGGAGATGEAAAQEAAGAAAEA